MVFAIHQLESAIGKHMYVPSLLYLPPIAALFIVARTWKQPRCPLINEGIRK